MSTTPAPSTLRTLYRALLRELPPRPVLSSPRAPLHQKLRESFQGGGGDGGGNGDSHRAELLAAQAEQYAAYLRAQRTYVTLLERYNPGMGMDEEERVRLTARRVGLNLPIEYKGEGEGEGGK